MAIDTHLHLAYEYDDINYVIKNAYDKGVFCLILGGSSPKDNGENMKIISDFDNMYAAVGYHPEFANVISNQDLRLLEKFIENNNKIIAIGEIGLDYYYENNNKKEQIELFKKQLNLAVKYSLPVVIHSRDAFLDTYNILKQYKLKGVIHCFSGSYEVAQKYIQLGYYLGIGGVVTFKNSNLKDVIQKIGLDNIVLETDSPYLSPIRGKKNEPANIVYIRDYLSKLLDIDVDRVEEITNFNAMSLFDLDV